MNIPFVAFPLESEDPKKKAEKDWLLQACRASLYSYSELPEGSIGLRSKNDYEKFKKYAQGRQPIAPYQKLLNNGEDGQNKMLVTDWKIRSEIPNLRRNLISIIQKIDFNPQINPIDILAKQEMEDEFLAMEAKLIAREAVKRMGAPEMLELPTLRIGADEPEDFDDLSIMELGMQHRTAMEMEMVVRMTMSANKYSQIRDQCAEDRVDYGVAFQKTDTVQGRTVSIRRCDPRFMVMSACVLPDFSDWKFIGEIRPYTVPQLLAMSDGQITEAQIKEVYDAGPSKISNYDIGLTYGSWPANSETYVQTGKLFVLDIEIKSTDSIVLETRTLPNGTPFHARINPKKADKNKKNTYQKKVVENIYIAKWVIGTDIIFDYGKKKNMKRDKSNPATVKSSYHISACDFYDMRTRSRIEELIPIADESQLARLKLQHTLNTVIPQGFFINLDALEGINLNAGGEKMEHEEILRLFYERGVFVGRSVTIDGKPAVPITKLEGGVGNEIVEYWTVINNAKLSMREVLGLNAFTDSSTPNPKSLTEIARAAMEGTNNALGDLLKVQRNNEISVTEDIVIRAQDIVHYGNTEYFLSSLGPGTMKILRHVQDVPKYLYSVSIEENPDQEQMITLNMQIEKAQEAGELGVDDIMRLNNMKSQKQKEMFVVNRVKKNRLRKQQEAIQLSQTNGDIQVQSAMAAEEEKRKTLQLEHELTMRLEKWKKDLEWRNTNAAKQYDLEDSRIDATGRVEAGLVQGKAKIAANLTDNKAKLIKEGKESKIGIIDVPAELRSTVEPQTAMNKPLEINKEFSFLPSPVMGELAPEELPAEEAAPEELMPEEMGEPMLNENQMQLEEQGEMA